MNGACASRNHEFSSLAGARISLPMPFAIIFNVSGLVMLATAVIS